MRTVTRSLAAIGAVFAAFAMAEPASGQATSAAATARVTARVLGPADPDVADGAVTISKIFDSGFPRVETPADGRPAAIPERTISIFRVGGGVNARFGLMIPDTAEVRGEESETPVVVRLRASANPGRLGSDGTVRVEVKGRVTIPADQLRGSYSGSYLVTIAYD
jgi:hypothetical protein